MKKYDSYKDSGVEWIGEIPNHWTLKKLKFFGNVTLGKMLTPEDKGGYELKPYLRAKNIEWNSPNIEDVKEMWFSEKELQQFRLYKNDLLVSEGGEVGRTCIWNDELLECYIQNSVHKVSFRNFENSRFFLNQFVLFGKRGHFDAIVNKISIAHLTKEKLSDVHFVYPPIEEQNIIANYLDHKTTQIEHLIAKKEQFIQLLEEERVAVINQAVTKGIDPTVPMKDSGIEWLGEIPEHWDVKKLKHITSKVTDGSHFSPPTESEGRFYISVTDITKSNSINFENSKRISDNSFEELARNGCKPIKGDILITKDGTIGRGVIVEDFDDFVILSSLGLIRLNNKQNPYYILFYLLSGLNIDQMYSNIRGSGITRLTIKLINDLIVVVPSFEEQIEIENYLKLKTIEIDKVIIKSKQEIELLKEYKTALISEVVTGKVDVRGEKLN